MAHIYDPKVLYDPATMPLVEGWEESNNCTFVRYHWCLTEADQKAVDKHWRPLFYRHSLINTKMALATHAGAGVPGWDPFLGKDRTALSECVTPPTDLCPHDKSLAHWDLSDQTLGTKIAQGKRIEPTGIENDPRVWRDPDAPRPRTDIVGLLRDAAARYEAELGAEHAELMADWRARKSGSWAQRAAAAKEPEPTLEDARKWRTARLSGPPAEHIQGYSWKIATVPGLWHEWEIVEIAREEARQNAVEAAWQRGDAYMKSRYPCWGGGT